MEEIINWLLNYAYDHGIGVVVFHRAPNIPSMASVPDNMIAINMCWEPKSEIPFSIAHEIGHILSGDNGHFLPTKTAQSQAERRANHQAVKILMKWADSHDVEVTTPQHFSECFGVPNTLSDSINEEFGEYKCRAK